MLDDIEQHMPDVPQLRLALHASQLMRVQSVLRWDNGHDSNGSTEHNFLFTVPSACLGVSVYQPGLCKDARGEKKAKHVQTFVLLVAVNLKLLAGQTSSTLPKVQRDLQLAAGSG